MMVVEEEFPLTYAAVAGDGEFTADIVIATQATAARDETLALEIAKVVVPAVLAKYTDAISSAANNAAAGDAVTAVCEQIYAWVKS